LPLEAPVRSDVRGPLPGLSLAARAAARGARADPRAEPGRPALVPAVGPSIARRRRRETRRCLGGRGEPRRRAVRRQRGRSRRGAGVIAALLLAASVALGAAPAHGRLTRYEIDAPELKDPRRSVRVYTPPGYDDTAGAERRYPVVYLLHGWPGSE